MSKKHSTITSQLEKKMSEGQNTLEAKIEISNKALLAKVNENKAQIDTISKNQTLLINLVSEIKDHLGKEKERKEKKKAEKKVEIFNLQQEMKDLRSKLSETEDARLKLEKTIEEKEDDFVPL